MTTWKDKRIEAINKIIKANPKSAKAVQKLIWMNIILL
jgi:hypothetical protein